MDIENGTYDFILNKKISVHTGQGQDEFQTLLLSEPGREHSKKALKLKQMFMRALKEFEESHRQAGNEVNTEIGVAEENEEKTEEQRLKDFDDVYQMATIALECSEKVDLGEFVDTFFSIAEKTALRPIVLIDGKYVLKDAHTSQMSLSEMQRLAVTYVSFFLTPSVMQGQ